MSFSESTRYTIRGAITVVTLFFDFWICYSSLYFPLRPFFIKEDHPWKSPPIWLANTVDLGTIALIVLLDFFLFYRFWRRPWTFYLAPIYTAVMVGAFVVTGVSGVGGPNATLDSTGNGYHYRTEIWFRGPDDREMFKRWKTKEPYDGVTNPEELRYGVDSVWFVKSGE